MNREAARTALQGVIIAVSYGRGDLGRHYLRLALRHDPHCWRTAQFWKAGALLAAPLVGPWIMRRRHRITARDLSQARSVERSLLAQREISRQPNAT